MQNQLTKLVARTIRATLITERTLERALLVCQVSAGVTAASAAVAAGVYLYRTARSRSRDS